MTDYDNAEESSPLIPRGEWNDFGVKPAFLINVLGGLVYGVSIGVLPVLFQFNQYLGNCERYTTQAACSTMTFANCQWVPATNASFSNFNTSPPYCGFQDHATVNCSVFDSEALCSAGDNAGSAAAAAAECYWRYHEKECVHVVGWSANQQGWIAGVQILGAMLATAICGFMTNSIGRRWSIAIAGIVGVVSCGFFSAGWQLKEQFALLMIAEFCIGFVGGLTCVVCPLYTEMVEDPKMRNVIGIFFQVACTFGSFLCGLVGFFIDPREDTATVPSSSISLQDRFEWVLALQWLTSLVLLPAAWWAPESQTWLKEQEHASRRASPTSPWKRQKPTFENSSPPLDDDNNEIQQQQHQHQHHRQQKEDAIPGDEEEEVDPLVHNNLSALFCHSENIVPLIVGTIVAAATQLTGINAIMLYSPILATRGALHMPPLMANFLVNTWNFVSSLPVIWLMKKSSPRVLFISMCGLAAVSCTITGVAAYPGVFEANSVTQTAVAGVGILMFIVAFELGIGPPFYVLSQDVFPAKVRALGCSFTVWMSMSFTFLLNYGFPLAMTALSGGQSGDQHLGMARCYFIFAAIGLLTAVVLGLKMPKTNSEKEHEALLLGQQQGEVA